MWRAFFLAVGITLCIVGTECLGLERVVLKLRDDPPKVAAGFFDSTPAATTGPRKTIVVRPHTPWSLLALGAVVILYAFDLPRRING
ncbi:MAG TPA: hypothetical protein VJL29_11580 [Thermoguttaceae bacterium]|nr:hypothetical protein [Thermoguttaceae bacterium]